jgi:FkbM family methyltransferase
MDELENSNLRKSFESQYKYWQSIGLEIESDSPMEKYIHGKITTILSNNLGRFIEYLPGGGSSTFLMKLESDDLRSAPIVALPCGVYEKGVEKVLEVFLSSAENFLDLGANIGFYSMFAVSINPRIRVMAFEPNPEVRKRLFGNLLINRVLTQVYVIPFGVSSNAGIAEFFVPPKSGTGAGSLRNLHAEEGEPVRFQVELHTIDEIFDTSSRIDVVKMDIEGAEFQAILGGEKLIASQQPVIVIELLRKWMEPFGSHPQDVLLKLRQLGYQCFGIHDTHLRQIQEIDEMTEETNFLFFPKSRDVSPLNKFKIT